MFRGFGLGWFTALPLCSGEVGLGFQGCSLERKGIQEAVSGYQEEALEDHCPSWGL